MSQSFLKGRFFKEDQGSKVCVILIHLRTEAV